MEGRSKPIEGIGKGKKIMADSTRTFETEKEALAALALELPEPSALFGVKYEATAVTATVDSRDWSRAYWKKVYTSLDGVLASLQIDEKEVCKNLTYGEDLRTGKGPIRILIVDEKGDKSEKIIAQMVTRLVKQRAILGKPITEEVARKKVMASLED